MSNCKNKILIPCSEIYINCSSLKNKYINVGCDLNLSNIENINIHIPIHVKIINYIQYKKQNTKNWFKYILKYKIKYLFK